ncbi:MAG: CDP-glycerol glycerophosphotransferase family protein [Coprococcus sp.]
MKQFLNYIFRKFMTACLIPFRLFPIRQNRILFISLEGGSQYEYSCNPKYFCEYLLDKCPHTYEIVWLFAHPDNYEHLKAKGIRTAKHFTPKGIYYALTSRVVLSNGGYFAWFPFRKKQLCINTWHGGGAYKKLENDMQNANSITKKRMLFAAHNMNAYISSCKQFTDHVIRKAFLFNGTVLSIGMPRNDLFFSEKKDFFYHEIRKKYQLPETCRILLYVPTFRTEHPEFFQKLDAAAVLGKLSQRTGEDWYLFNHSHTKADGRTDITNENNHCLDVSRYPDIQELLCAADWMISDYSSVIWDYCQTQRPLLLYVPDLKYYISNRGFYLDIRQWGFPLCQSMDELLNEIETVPDDAQDKALHHLQLLGSYENGQACCSLLKYIERNI